MSKTIKIAAREGSHAFLIDAIEGIEVDKKSKSVRVHLKGGGVSDLFFENHAGAEAAFGELYKAINA